MEYSTVFLVLDRWAFASLTLGSLRGKAPQFVPSNDSAAGGQRAFEMPVGLRDKRPE